MEIIMISTFLTALVHIGIGLGISVAVVDITNTVVTTVSEEYSNAVINETIDTDLRQLEDE